MVLDVYIYIYKSDYVCVCMYMKEIPVYECVGKRNFLLNILLFQRFTCKLVAWN